MNARIPLSLTLETARVIIEAVDKNTLVQYFPSETLMEFSENHRYFSISNPDDHALIGWLCMDEKENNADILYIWIIEDYRSSKVFRETIFAINNYILNVAKLEKISAKIPIDNARAKSAFLKGAYIPDTVRGISQNHSLTEEFSILQNEWPLRAIQFFGDIIG